jgi:hypothetical protein
MRAEELDKIFDDGKEDILPYLDLAKAVRPGHAAKRINVDFPEWMLSRLDLEAERLGIPPPIAYQDLDRRASCSAKEIQTGQTQAWC